MASSGSVVADITPKHEPVGLAREMLELAPGTVAGAYVLVQEDGVILFDTCGHDNRSVLWGLQKMCHNLMTGGDG